ncbi:MAG: hypothetical protein AAF462_02020 [Thermodesulfobacteriota bacterium]
MKIKSVLYICSFLLLALSIGCPSIDKPYPERTFYLFDVTPSSKNSNPIQGASIAVNRFSISPSADGREFIYRTTELEFKTDFYNQFFRPPDNLLTETTRQWINQSGVSQDVLSPASRAVPEFIIEGNVVELYGDYRNESAAKAIIRIQMFLLQNQPDGTEPKILLAKTYNSEQPIGAASPTALMDGYNRALEDILGEFAKDLSYHIRQAQKSSTKSDS